MARTALAEYALYKGDEYIDQGTAKELAEKYGLKVVTVQFMATKTYHERANKGNRRIAVRIED